MCVCNVGKYNSNYQPRLHPGVEKMPLSIPPRFSPQSTHPTRTLPRPQISRHCTPTARPLTIKFVTSPHRGHKMVDPTPILGVRVRVDGFGGLSPLLNVDVSLFYGFRCNKFFSQDSVQVSNYSITQEFI